MQKCIANDISIEQSDGCTGAQLRTLHWALSFQGQFHNRKNVTFSSSLPSMQVVTSMLSDKGS